MPKLALQHRPLWAHLALYCLGGLLLGGVGSLCIAVALVSWGPWAATLAWCAETLSLWAWVFFATSKGTEEASTCPRS